MVRAAPAARAPEVVQGPAGRAPALAQARRTWGAASQDGDGGVLEPARDDGSGAGEEEGTDDADNRIGDETDPVEGGISAQE